MITAEHSIGGIAEATTSQDLGPFFENKYGDKYLYSVNGSTFAKMPAPEVYKDFFGENLFKEESLFLVIGTDSGLMIKYIIEQGVPEDSRFIFLELPEVITRLAEVIALAELPESIQLTSLDNLAAALSKFQARHYIYSKQLFTQPTLCSMDLQLSAYSDLQAEVQAAMTQAVWNTELHLGNHGFVERQIENLADNRLSSLCLRNFKDKLQGKTAVVLGVGPSLDDILPWVKEHQEELIIIAVSRACRRLHEVGIIPHFIVSVDPSIYSFDVSRDMLHFCADSIFVHGVHVSPPLVGHWSGTHLYMGPRFPWATPLNIPTLPPHGPTVTQTALTIATELGFSQVVLGGVDLCFNHEGQVYGKTTQGREKGLNPGGVHGGVETYGGWQAETIYAFVGGISVTGLIAAQAKQAGCRIVNMAIGAAKIPNIDFVPTDQIELEPLDFTPKEILSQIIADDPSISEKIHCQEMLTELVRAKNAYKMIEKLSLKAIQINNDLFAGESSGGNKKLLDKIEKQLNGKLAEFSVFAKRYGILKFLKIVQPGKDSLEKYDDVEKAGRLYYEAYRDTARVLTGLLEHGEKRLRMRLEEHSDVINYPELLDYWDAGKLYGRAEIVKQTRPDFFREIKEDDLVMLDTITEKFIFFMDRKENLSPISKPTKKDYTLLKSRLQLFFVRQTVNSLRILSDDLASDDTSEGKALYLLSRGYLMELEKNLEKALQYYEKVVDGEDQSVLEKALVRIAAISFVLKDDANLKLAFECLAHLSPLYMPKYADLLWLEGDIEQALETYVSYMNKVPSDLLSMLKLGRYYLEAGSLEGGEMAYDYVLEKDPDNRTAQEMLVEVRQLKEID